MRTFWVVLGLLLVSLSVARPDRNAFLNRHAGSVAQLVEQVRTDAEVSDRFQRHFAMNQREVLAYLSSLKLARLTTPGTYQVYSIPPGGFVKMHVQKLKLGTPVFADMFGSPVLIAKCGNPLTRGPKVPESAKNPEPKLSARVTEDLRELEAQPDELSEFEELIAMTPEVPGLSNLPEEIITTNESPIPIIGTPLGIGPWLLGLLGGGLIIGTIDGGGDTVVPEPATLGAVALATGYVLRRRTRRTGR
jgi:hypothetical protein